MPTNIYKKKLRLGQNVPESRDFLLAGSDLQVKIQLIRVSVKF